MRRHVAAAVRFDHEVGARAGLTLSTCEANFIGLLLLHGPLTPGQLGKLAGLSSSGTITGVIDRLERAGYVSRGRCTADRRKVFVTLNQDWLDQQNAPRSRRLAEILDHYDDGQLAVITDFITRLAETETAAMAPASAPTGDEAESA
jgi:DNA-binding MarR family transcriptional regulator